MSFSDFSLYNTWTVTVNVNVLNEFDMNGNDVIESAWNEYIEPQNDVSIQSLQSNKNKKRLFLEIEDKTQQCDFEEPPKKKTKKLSKCKNEWTVNEVVEWVMSLGD
eukprot:376597_1